MFYIHIWPIFNEWKLKSKTTTKGNIYLIRRHKGKINQKLPTLQINNLNKSGRKSCIIYLVHLNGKTVLLQPHVDYLPCAPQYTKDIKILESVQRRAAKLVKRLECVSSEDTWVFSLEKRLSRNLIALCSFLGSWNGKGDISSSPW